MKDNEIKLNASGYKDEPCYKTIRKMDVPKPGEIWENGKNGKTVLVLGNMNGICSILNLIDQEKEGRIKVQARVPMYTSPIMVSWCFTTDLTNYVKTITEDNFTAVKLGVADALGRTIMFRYAEPLKEHTTRDKLQAEYDELLDENKAMERRNAELLEERDKLLEEITGYGETIKRQSDELQEYRRTIVIQENEHKAAILGAQKSMVYKELYTDLMERVMNLAMRGYPNE